MNKAKHIIYTHPALTQIDMGGEFLEYIRQRIGTPNVAFVRSMINQYYLPNYLMAAENKGMPMHYDEYKLLYDGSSMSELIHLIDTDYDAYFNTVIFSLLYDFDTWSDALMRTSSNLYYRYLNVPYEAYKHFWSAFSSIPPSTLKEYTDECEIIQKYVIDMNSRMSFNDSSRRRH